MAVDTNMTNNENNINNTHIINIIIWYHIILYDNISYCVILYY